VPLLGEVPLDEPLRVASDAGLPLVLDQPDSASARAIAEIAAALPGALRPRSGAERIDRRLSVR
jgi:ATP-binding protein involved in chromosome partitioning